MKHTRLELLAKPLFILALALLLLNDFYLKYTYANFITGKLSDVAGLFLFPYFFACLQINWTKKIYFGTALLFVFWKSQFSQIPINYFQNLGIGIHRTVDYTDLFALLILPLSYYYFQKQVAQKTNLSKFFTIPLIISTLFAIWATTIPNKNVELDRIINMEYEVKMSKSKLFNTIKAKHGFSDTFEKNISDSLFYLTFELNEDYSATATAISTITAIDAYRTKIKLHKIICGDIKGKPFSGVNKDDVAHLKSISSEKFKANFEKNFLKALNNGKAEKLFFDNKAIYDTYNKDK